ncbi:triose-phosphate isomerase [Desulfonatronovibrio magnus]|uniref:triose-phosphate isomerase n=1 Tax=Desulfonatronovibrio magnus TaxID=698827 RepID=UPI0005EAF98F|nr:triose-phosphate isomerase [Desulfonatronovibrio magnus]RQD65419.1 MAG: triose-phosphate isomerase [Desulfonatronovibrio sp. MSAO_Bac4]
MLKKIMAANWKMYKTRDDASRTARELVVAVGDKLPDDREVLLIPPFTALYGVSEMLAGQTGYFLGGQNFYPEQEGAYTGEISPQQLTDCGCSFALVGHSERRHVLGERDDFLAEKVLYGLNSNLKIILCIGETIEERKQGLVEQVLLGQLEKGLARAGQVKAENFIIAYEPVWAIGTGETAGPEDIAQAHDLIRSWLEPNQQEGKDIRILYGGSVKPDNCATIISLDNVDGVLVGGASLKADSFSKIVTA